MREKPSLQKLEEGEYSKIIYKLMPKPHKCGVIIEGFLVHKPKDATCKNEADYHLAGELTESGMFRKLHCLCEKCLKEVDDVKET